jgi:hypothetical protein
MDEEIILDRGDTEILKLDEDEQALMDEIQISTSKPQPRPRRPMTTPRPRPMMQQQEEIDAFANPTKQTVQANVPSEEVDYGEAEPYFDDDGEGDYGGGGGYVEQQPSKGYASIDEEKADLLNKLARLEKKGVSVNKRLNMYSSVDDIRTEVKRITYGIEVDQSVKFSRRMLVACVTGLEFLNKRYNPFEIQLEGWSESVMESVEDYDTVFEELYVKYRNKVNVAPEVKLIMMLGGSAMMFHLTNSMFKAAIPNVNDVLKQNPDLVKNMMSAVQNTTTQQAAPAATDGSYEMQGPGIDISSLMGGIMMPPPPPMNTSTVVREDPLPTVAEEDDVSDIVSISGESTGGELKEVNVGTSGSKRGRKKKKTEINL